MNVQIEQWLMQKKVPLVSESVEYFRNNEYLKIIESFLFDATF